MSNPFDYIKHDREEKVRLKEQQDAGAKRKTEEKRQQHKKVFVEAVNGYGPMVTSVLESLRDAAYPHQTVTSPDTSSYAIASTHNPVWCIGFHLRNSSSEYGVNASTERFDINVKVTLEINNNNVPAKFICWQKSGSQTYSQLREADLIVALKRLHPISK